MSTSAIALGFLERVDDLRGVWKTEDQHFTPWLAEEANITLLGDVIRLDLEVEAQEVPVGSFRSDLLCRDKATGNRVVVENQLTRTDHDHLGKLLTYMADFGAVTGVWIAKLFTDEHRAAIDWLNEITHEQFNFFGLEIELWRIGTSLIAPKFNVVCKPNDWSKTIAAAIARGGLKDAEKLWLDFWTAFRSYFQEHSQLRPPKPTTGRFVRFPIGRKFKLSAIVATPQSPPQSNDSHELQAAVVLPKSMCQSDFASLEARKTEIEKEMGEEVIWYNPSDKEEWKIYPRQPATLANRSKWDTYHAWLLQKVEAWHKILALRAPKVDGVVAQSGG